MLKALLKKQLLEFFSGFFSKGKNEKSGGKSSKVFMAFILGFVGVSFFFMFFSMAFMMSPVIEQGNAEVYFSVFGVLSALLGIFGSVFLTYNTLYEAKDNDLLLSMPIPPWMILFSRMAGLYITAFMFESLVMLPAFAVYLIVSPFEIPSFIFSFINLFIMPLFALSIACVLGWVIAFFASKIRNKSIITVAFSMIFFGVYYFFAMRLNTFINMIIINTEEVGEAIRKYLYPIYKMGQGCSGDAVSYLVFIFIVFALFSLVYKVLSVSFLKFATSKRGMKKIEYKEKKVKKASSKMAFLKKELLYFKNTPVYMLNGALGSVILILFAVVFAVKSEDILSVLSVTLPFSFDVIPVFVGFVLCFIASTNNLTSSSVSLEAKTLWLVKSVPINIKDILFGKLMLHICVTGIPLLVANIIVCTVLKSGIIMSLLLLIFTELFMTVCAVTGLAANLIFPKTDWTNEAVPIKQSISAMIGMFFGMLYTMFIILLWYLTASIFSPLVFLVVIILISAAVFAFEYRWLITAGTKKFMEIQ